MQVSQKPKIRVSDFVRTSRGLLHPREAAARQSFIDIAPDLHRVIDTLASHSNVRDLYSKFDKEDHGVLCSLHVHKKPFANIILEATGHITLIPISDPKSFRQFREADPLENSKAAATALLDVYDALCKKAHALDVYLRTERAMEEKKQRRAAPSLATAALA